MGEVDRVKMDCIQRVKYIPSPVESIVLYSQLSTEEDHTAGRNSPMVMSLSQYCWRWNPGIPHHKSIP